MKNIYGKNSNFINDYCEDVIFQLCDIEEFILDKEIITNKSLANLCNISAYLGGTYAIY
jgi:hypothetical protein